MVMVSFGVEERLYVSKEPVRSKVAESEDMKRAAFTLATLGFTRVRRRRREEALHANMVIGGLEVAEDKFKMVPFRCRQPNESRMLLLRRVAGCLVGGREVHVAP